MSAKNSDFYANKVILAPMVRAGRTALRNLVLDYGADLAYTEELVDEKLLKAQRSFNEILQTVDYKIDEDDVVLRISKTEKSQCVLQVGSCSKDNLVAVCKKYSDDVAAIDINMGCPKPFSLSGGMGAALLSKPDLVKEMITSLVEVSPIPVSCKIRVLNTVPETIEFAQMLERCGISALGVHGRQKEERPNHRNRFEEIREVARALSIPVISNGESSCIKAFEDIGISREKCGSSSIMLARIGLQQPSIFRREGILSMDEEIDNFLDKALLFDECHTMTKYVIQRILGSEQAFDQRGRATVQAGSMKEICKAWNKEDLYNEFMTKYNRLSQKRKGSVDENGLFQIDVTFPPKRLKEQPANTPKCIIVKYCKEKHLEKPTYESKITGERRFICTVSIGDKKFASTVPQANKRFAEQIAALAACYGLNIRDRLEGDWD